MVQDSPSSSRPGAETSWTEIEDLLDHLAQRASEPLSAQEFYAELANQAVPAMAAVAGAVWSINSQGQIELAHQVNLQATEIGASEDAIEAHGQLLQKAASQKNAFSVPPGKLGGPGERNGQPANPTDFLILFSPIRAENDVVAVLEIFQRPKTSAAAQHGFLRFLETLGEIAADFNRRQELRELRERAALWGKYEAFAERVHADLDLDRTASVLANDGRALIGCDRVSVVMRKGRKNCRLTAMSGQDHIERRANVVRLMEELCVSVVKMSEPLWYHEDGDDLPPQIEGPLQKYLDEAHSRSVAVVPLTEPPDDEEPFARRKIHGALVAERFDADPDPEATRHRVEAVCGHGSAAIRNSLTHQGLPFFKVLKAVQNAAWYVSVKNLPTTTLVLGLIAAVIGGLIFIPADFTVSGEGELQPQIRRDVFAWSDGVVESVNVDHGQDVVKGQIVAEMRNTELDAEIQRVKAELANAQVRWATVKALMPTAQQRSREEFLKLSAENEEIPKLIASLDRQMEILDQQKRELKVQSPIAGQVLTWDVRPLLDNRPVSRGQVLMTVADLTGSWIVEIRVPDDRIGHVLKAQKEQGDDLTVEFLLATDPETTYAGKISKISMTTDPGEESAASVLITVSINKDDVPNLRPGATVIPKISCGTKPVGYVWFHGLIDAVKTYVLF